MNERSKIEIADVGCPHPKQYRLKENAVEYCVVCAKERIAKSNDKLGERIRNYLGLMQGLPLDAAPGTKVVFWAPQNGYDQDIERSKDIPFGQVLTIESMNAGSFVSYARVWERKEPINTVQLAVFPTVILEAWEAMRAAFDWALEPGVNIATLAEDVVPKLEKAIEKLGKGMVNLYGLTRCDYTDATGQTTQTGSKLSSPASEEEDGGKTRTDFSAGQV